MDTALATQANFDRGVGQSLMEKAKVFCGAFIMEHELPDGTHETKSEWSYKAHYVSLGDLVDLSGLSDFEARLSNNLRLRAIDGIGHMADSAEKKNRISEIFPQVRTVSEYFTFIQHPPQSFLDALVSDYLPQRLFFIPREGPGTPTIDQQADQVIEAAQSEFLKETPGTQAIKAVRDLMTHVPKLQRGNYYYDQGALKVASFRDSASFILELNNKLGACYLSTDEDCVYTPNDQQFYLPLNTTLRDETHWNRKMSAEDPNIMMDLILPPRALGV